MATLLFLIQVSRSILWPVLPLVFYLGMHAAGASVSAAAVVQMLTLTFPMNLIGCGLNDLYDIDSDRRSVRRRAMWGAEVCAEHRSVIVHACYAMATFVVIVALVIHNAWNMAATCGLLAAAWAYSVPPVRLKERPPLDSLANGVGFFLLPFVMGYSLGGNPAEMPLRYYLLALCVCAIHALATAADYDADKAAGHRTLAVVYGRRTAAAVALATFLVAWWFGDFRGSAARVFVLIGVLATLLATLFPRDRPIFVACVTIFVGFIVAAVCHVLSW